MRHGSVTGPRHPAYPCAQCAPADMAHAVLGAEWGRGTELVTSSASPHSAARRFTDLNTLLQEMATARAHGGAHYSFSTEASTDLGQRVGTLAARRFAGDWPRDDARDGQRSMRDAGRLTMVAGRAANPR